MKSYPPAAFAGGDVPPGHRTDADGYLVARRVPRDRRPPRSGDTPGEQSPLDDPYLGATTGEETRAENEDG